MLNNYTNIHFVGIGGAGMSGLAEIFLNLGYQVSGSDLSLSKITERLEKLGARIFEGHQAFHVADKVDLLVYSAAIDETNIEMLIAKQRGLPCFSRGEMLADVTRLKQNVVAVAGSHGKTTVTTMIANILWIFDKNSTAIIGGVLQRQDLSARWGQGNMLVAETDEHDGSFLKLSPTVAVVTNIDFEHIEYYHHLDDLKKDFICFINKVPFYGFAVICLEDLNVKSIISQLRCRYLTYGWDNKSDIYATHIVFEDDLRQPRASFAVYNTHASLGKLGFLGRVCLRTLGKHNVLNALSAITVGLGLGFSFDTCLQGLDHFVGIQRRMEIDILSDDIVLIEDYAHHPSEMKAILSSIAKPKLASRIVIFQPHLYSRTAHFFREFAQELMVVDRVILLPIYPAREKPIEGVASHLIAQSMLDQGFNDVTVLKDKAETVDCLKNYAKKGDIVFVLGAGDVYHVAEDLRNNVLLQKECLGLGCN